MSQMNDFAEIVARKRKEKKMTQGELAAQLGISPQAVSKWENGLGLPDVTLFPLLAETLEISLEELFGMEVPQKVEERVLFVEENGYADENCRRKGDKFALVEKEWNGFPQSIDSVHFSIHVGSQIRILKSEVETCKLHIKSPKLFMAATEVAYDNDTLTVRIKPSILQEWKFRPNQKSEITLWVPFEKGKKAHVSLYSSGAVEITPDFEEGELKISGSGSFAVRSFEKRLEARISGSGNICGQEIFGTTKLRISGSGNISFIRATDADIKISGSGKINLGYLQGKSVVQISGSGKVKAAEASGKLSTKVSGSGGVEIERMQSAE